MIQISLHSSCKLSTATSKSMASMSEACLLHSHLHHQSSCKVWCRLMSLKWSILRFYDDMVLPLTSSYRCKSKKWHQWSIWCFSARFKFSSKRSMLRCQRCKKSSYRCCKIVPLLSSSDILEGLSQEEKFSKRRKATCSLEGSWWQSRSETWSLLWRTRMCIWRIQSSVSWRSTYSIVQREFRV